MNEGSTGVVYFLPHRERRGVGYNRVKVQLFMVFRSLFQLSQSIVLALALLSGETHAQSHTSSGTASQQAALQKGQAALRNGNLSEARAELEKAVRLAPNDAAAQSAFGWVLALQGENDAAVVHLRTALKINPGLVQAQLTLASVLSQQGNLAEGVQEARAAIKTAPGNAEAHRTLARILSQTQPDEASTEMQRAVELASERADLRDELGPSLLSANNLPKQKARS